MKYGGYILNGILDPISKPLNDTSNKPINIQEIIKTNIWTITDFPIYEEDTPSAFKIPKILLFWEVKI